MNPNSPLHQHSNTHLNTNTYYANQQNSTPPLDTNAPILQQGDNPRINKKALVFLLGIIVLLLILFVFLYKSFAFKKEPKPKAPRQETIEIPELPRSSSEKMVAKIQQEPQPIIPSEPENLPPPVPLAEKPVRQPKKVMPANYSHAAPINNLPKKPSLLERRIIETENNSVSSDFFQHHNNDNNSARDNFSTAGNSAKRLSNPDALLVRGTYLRCVLETRVITDIAGFTSCIITEPVYSINGKNLLLPKGSKIYGSYNGGIAGKRVSIIWDRIITPTGIDMTMASPGVDNLGGAGHTGEYSAHWGSRITSALLISMLSDTFKYIAAENAPESTTETNGTIVTQPFDSNTARTMERLANQALNRSGQRQPTITIHQGSVVNIYVSKDVDFSAVLLN